MNDYDSLIRAAPLIEQKLGHSFRNKDLLGLSFVHRSYINENKGVQQHNERLEFLGDAVLNLIVSAYLYEKLPSTPEGELSYLRSRLVEANSCYVYIQKLGVEEYLLLGRGEKMNAGRGRLSILADLFEALIGSIYLDGGIEMAKTFIFKNFSGEIDAILKTPIRNFKAELQDIAQKKYKETPLYHVLSETGPDHSKHFIISVSIRDEVFGEGTGASKKEAQQRAASEALKRLEDLNGES